MGNESAWNLAEPVRDLNQVTMKGNTMKPAAYIVIMAAAGLITGCNQNSEPASGQNATGQDIKQQAVQTKDEFVAAMDKKMKELDAKIDELSAKAADYKDDAKVQADKALADLRAQRDKVRLDYDAVKQSSQDDWEKTKAAFQSAWDDLVKHYDDAKAKLTQS